MHEPSEDEHRNPANQRDILPGVEEGKRYHDQQIKENENPEPFLLEPFTILIHITPPIRGFFLRIS